MNLVIADRNIEYATRLSASLAQNYKQTFSISVFSEERDLIEFLNNNRTEVLLIDTSLINTISEPNQIRLVLAMTGNKAISPDLQLEDIKIIKKYQRISAIVNEIFDNYAGPSNFYLFKQQETAKVIVVYSPSGGVGKSTLAVAIANKYSLLGHKAFYLNLEKFPCTGTFFKVNEGKGMSDLLKSLSQEVGLEFRMRALTRKDSDTGIAYFTAPDNITDIEAITVEELKLIVRTLISGNICNYLIIDTAVDIGNKNRELFNMADQIIIVGSQGKASYQRLESIENAGFLFDKYKEKLSLIINKVNVGTAIHKTKINIVAEIPVLQIAEPKELSAYIARNCPIELTC